MAAMPIPMVAGADEAAVGITPTLRQRPTSLAPSTFTQDTVATAVQYMSAQTALRHLEIVPLLVTAPKAAPVEFAA